MESIIPAVSTALIESELTPERFLRTSNKAGNHIYVVNAHNAPHTMQEIGRLREISFREAGGGTGKACDIDEFDTMERPCQQLIVWDPERREILGGYRYIFGRDVAVTGGQPHIAMAHIFRFSDQFVQQVLPATVELGRSFVTPFYQSSRAGARAIFALDNLWDGLGAVTVLHPEIEYLAGKMTMYTTYPRKCRNLLLHFLNTYFPDPDGWAQPVVPLPDTAIDPDLEGMFVGNDFKADYVTLKQYVRDNGINIPPLVNSYMNLSPKMRILGTAVNDDFGDVEETGLIIRIDEIAPGKRDRHIHTFDSQDYHNRRK